MKKLLTLILCTFSLSLFSQTSNMPLHEVFTSSTCGPCVAGNQNLTTIFDANPERQTVVKYQMSWPGDGDPYYTSEGGTRQGYYNVTAVPRLLVDGGWDANPSTYTSVERDAYYFSDSYVLLTASHTISLAGNKLTVDVSVTPLMDYNTNNKVFIAVVENRTTGNVGTNGEVEFYSVMMKMLPNASGTILGTLQNGVTEIVHEEYILQSNDYIEEVEDLSVVVWVQNYIDKTVYQSMNSIESGVYVDELTKENLVEVYPNPTSEKVHLLLNTTKDIEYSIKDSFGREVLKGIVSTNFIDVSGLAAGSYIIQFYCEKIRSSSKILLI